MKTQTALFLCAALMVPSASFGAEPIADILAKDRPAPPAEVGYRYTMTLDATKQKGDDPMDTLRAAIRVDPSQPPGERTDLLLIEASDEEAAGKMIADIRADIEDQDHTPADMAAGFYCTLDADMAHTVDSETETEAVLRPDPGALMLAMQGADDGGDGMSKSERRMMEKIAKRMEGEIRLAKPSGQVLSQSVRLTEPVTMMVVAKIKQMEFAQSCTPAPNGFMRSDTFTMLTEAGALGGTMESEMRFAIADLEAITP